MDFSFYKGRSVLITGHTGFKGAWLSYILENLGARVTGYSLAPPTTPSLFELCRIENRITSVIGDIRNLHTLKAVFEAAKPEIVFHLAAQPIVKKGYSDPVYTYDTNIMGTVNVLECARLFPCVKSLLNITSDKAYENLLGDHCFAENERLDGYDPYSNSKSCSELITACYKRSFFADGRTAVSTARAGNVIGGGDFSPDRIIPDCIRAIMSDNEIIIRNPESVRPYQHVLDALYAYMLIAMKQYEDFSFADSYNIAPDEGDCLKTSSLVRLFAEKWGGKLRYLSREQSNPVYEGNMLTIDCSKMKSVFGWRPVWNIDTALEKTAEWTLAFINKEDITAVMEKQIKEYQANFILNGF